jgi:hypothetical protein
MEDCLINLGTAASNTTASTYYIAGALAFVFNTTTANHNVFVSAANTQSFGTQ